MTLEHIFIGLIVAVSLALGARSLWRTWSGKGVGGCSGCAGCQGRTNDACGKESHK